MLRILALELIALNKTPKYNFHDMLIWRRERK